MAKLNFDDDPNYWWLWLYYARRDGRREDAAEAQERLAELGVIVTFQSDQPKGEPCKT